jgi:prepilin-type N-terminal cleavage/methylation domain-containing protein
MDRLVEGKTMQREYWKGKGFTLIELLVVIAIIMVLAALLVPSLKIAIKQAMSVHCSSNMHQIYLCMTDWMKDHDQIEPIGNYNGLADFPYWERCRFVNYLLDEGGYLEEPTILFCPQHGLDAFQHYSPTVVRKYWLFPTTYQWIYHSAETTYFLGPANRDRPDGYQNVLMFDSGSNLHRSLREFTSFGALRSEHYNVLHYYGNVEVNFADTYTEAVRTVGMHQ